MNRVVEARIEIPMGSQNKYEVKKDGKIKLDRVNRNSEIMWLDFVIR